MGWIEALYFCIDGAKGSWLKIFMLMAFRETVSLGAGFVQPFSRGAGATSPWTEVKMPKNEAKGVYSGRAYSQIIFLNLAFFCTEQ